jgi:hypothetical protein
MSGNSNPERLAELRQSGYGFMAKPASAHALRAWLARLHQAMIDAEDAAATAV